MNNSKESASSHEDLDFLRPSAYIYYADDTQKDSQVRSIQVEDSTSHLERTMPHRKQGTRTRVKYNRLLDEYLKAPLSLSDCPKAPDPIPLNARPGYMQSEDYCMLIWYVRTLPYVPNTSSLVRWNWARTHGLLARSLESMASRWCVLQKYIGNGIELRANRLRAELVKSDLFFWNESTIFDVDICAAKEKNADCLSRQDLAVDSANLITDEDRRRRSRMINQLEGQTDYSGRELLSL